MKILICHNYYRSSAPSGEDAVAENEINLLKEHGHEVFTYSKYNDDLDDTSLLKKIVIAKKTIWSNSSYNELKDLLTRIQPDIVHFHSIFPQISPSGYKACYDANIPVIHTLHNFRSICPGALLQRNEQVCELCLHGSILNSLRYKCYRNSTLATGTLTATIMYNRMIGSYKKYVSQYIALTDFSASRMIMGKIPENLISIKPNFLPLSPEPGTGSGGYAVYVGRLSVEKGVKTLFSAWKDINMKLKVIGDGPLMQELKSLPPDDIKNIEFCGYLDRQAILEIIKDAVFQLVPSEWYEGFPMVLLEALSCGTPVIGSDIGSIGEIIIDGETGKKFIPGNINSLRSTIEALISDQNKLSEMRITSRQTYEKKYSKEISYDILMDIYHKAMKNRS
ncbi:MAG: glycosyltransferase family 4 protein [Gammaproteobacteria bacterium]|nr:glycosyltransferase family 4 protein [Gammaproteobacteria bacterium]